MRDETRHPITLAISYTIEDDPSPHKEMAKNISEGGLCLLTKEEIEIGTEIEVTFSIGDDTCTLVGFSVWCKESLEYEGMCEVGIQFDIESLDIAPSIVQTVCDIYDYKNTIEIEEGRTITLQEAAVEFKQGIKGNQTQ